MHSFLRIHPVQRTIEKLRLLLALWLSACSQEPDRTKVLCVEFRAQTASEVDSNVALLADDDADVREFGFDRLWALAQSSQLKWLNRICIPVAPRGSRCVDATTQLKHQLNAQRGHVQRGERLADSDGIGTAAQQAVVHCTEGP